MCSAVDALPAAMAAGNVTAGTVADSFRRLMRVRMRVRSALARQGSPQCACGYAGVGGSAAKPALPEHSVAYAER